MVSLKACAAAHNTFSTQNSHMYLSGAAAGALGVSMYVLTGVRIVST